MPAFNVVCFRVKPGQEERFIEAHKKARPKFQGFIGGNLIKTGDRTYCIIGEWRNMKSMADARDEMIGILDTFRDTLEDQGGDLGLTDPVAGEVVARLAIPKPAARKRTVEKKSRSKG